VRFVSSASRHARVLSPALVPVQCYLPDAHTLTHAPAISYVSFVQATHAPLASYSSQPVVVFICAQAKSAPLASAVRQPLKAGARPLTSPLHNQRSFWHVSMHLPNDELVSLGSASFWFIINPSVQSQYNSFSNDILLPSFSVHCFDLHFWTPSSSYNSYLFWQARHTSSVSNLKHLGLVASVINLLQLIFDV